MVKLVIVMHRRPDMSVEAFRSYMWETHLPIVARLPRVRRVKVKLPLLAISGEEGAPDGIGEDRFDSMEDLQAALASQVGQEAAADGPSFLDMSRTQMLAMEEHEVPLPAEADAVAYAAGV